MDNSLRTVISILPIRCRNSMEKEVTEHEQKKLVASLVATMAVGATAFAANPFVDVPQDSWAYNSVVELANSGIIQGV